MSGPTLFALSSAIRQPARGVLSCPLCPPRFPHCRRLPGQPTEPRGRRSRPSRVGGQAAGGAHHSLGSDPGAGPAVQEVSLKTLKLDIFWIFGARSGVYHPARFIADCCHLSVLDTSPPASLPPLRRPGDSLPVCWVKYPQIHIVALYVDVRFFFALWVKYT